jgi:hypothetical protein
MSQFLNLTELVILAESILRRGRGVRYSDFCPQLLSSLLFRGHHLCEKALPLIREGADSPTETYLRLLLIKNGLPEPSINYAVPGVCWAGRFPIKFDLGYEQQRVLIEYDGRHHAEINQRFIDNEKRTFIESLGWRVLVIDSEEIKNIDEMCARIKRLVVM